MTKEQWQEWVAHRWDNQPGCFLVRDIMGTLDAVFDEDELSTEDLRNMIEERLKKYVHVAIMGLGIGGEAGEVQEHVKKFIRDGKVPDRDKFVWELGDVLHYLTRIASEFGYTLEEIMQANVDKLEARDRGKRVG